MAYIQLGRMNYRASLRRLAGQPSGDQSMLQKALSLPRTLRTAVLLVAALSFSTALWAAPPKITESGAKQMEVLANIKTSKSAEQHKIDSRLFMAILKQRQDPRLNALPDFRFVQPDANGRIEVDVEARSTNDVKAVVERIRAAGGSVGHSKLRQRAVRAVMPITAIEGLASFGEVRKVNLAQKAFTHGGINTSEGDVAHRAAEARGFFGVNGSGVKICVLSDGVDSLATLQASGDLPPVVDVLPGQAGSGDEGSAMLEIVHDLAPGATLGFATALPTQNQFATNILALAADGCNIIVDDILYLAESPFQDSEVADAVNQVTATGVLYFSSAGNEGNFNDGSSGTWEGDFNPNGTPPALAGGGVAHNFGDAGQSQLVTAGGVVVTLHWTDVFGASGNDYDVYDMDPTLTTIFDASTAVQDGDDDPVEISGFSLAGERLVVMLFSGVNRMINLNNFRGTVGIQTTGCIRGHNSAVNAFATAAVDVADAAGPGNTFNGTESVELFSCDGPRRIFFDFAGALLPGAPAGNFSQTGGVIRQKPDIAAGDGVMTAAPGFNPFFGTSAAAPHAAAIAGLVKQAFPAFTAAQIRTALEASALDIEAAGDDRDSGEGIVMAYETLEDLGASPQAFLDDGAPVPTQAIGDGDGAVEPNEVWNLTVPLTNVGGANATAISAVLTTSTPGVTIVSGNSAYPDLAPAASGNNTTPYTFAVGPAFACGNVIDFTLTVTYTGGPSPQVFTFSIGTGAAGAPVTVSYAGPVVPIPDAADLSGTMPGAPAIASLLVGAVPGNILDIDLRIDGATCSATAGSTTVGIDHSFVNDLEIILRSPTTTTVLTIDNTDGSGNNFCQTLLDDESAGPSIQSVAAAANPFTGSFTPNAPLSGFDGEDPNGTWQLQVQDFFQFDIGNIRAWSLIITPAICDAPPLTVNVTGTKSISGGDQVEGGTVTYTVVLTNSGTGTQLDNPGNEFSDLLPPQLTVGTPTATSGTVSGPGVNPVTWNGSIGPGGSVTITIPATIADGTAGQTINNQGTINFDADVNGTNESTGQTDAPGGGANEPTSFVVIAGGFDPAIPTLSEWGLMALAVGLMLAAWVMLRRRKTTA
jgi:uncharacterized repeat protein (TIGR01451 family)